MNEVDVTYRLQALAALTRDQQAPPAVWKLVDRLDRTPPPRPRLGILQLPMWRSPRALSALAGLAAVVVIGFGTVAVASRGFSFGAQTVPQPFDTQQAVFNPENRVVFQVRSDSAETPDHWRLVAYDRFSGSGWKLSASMTSTIGAGQALEQDGPRAGRIERRYAVTVLDPSQRWLVVAGEPVSVSVNVDLISVGGGATQMAYAKTDASAYMVTTLMPDFRPSGLTAAMLRAAGRDYPTGLKEIYTQGADLVGADGRQLLNTILTTLPSEAASNPYDVARAIEGYLGRTGPFTYRTDLRDLQSECAGLSTVDCFARTKQGFCQQFATTMTMLLRMQGIPARYAQGYLAGPLDPQTNIQNVTAAQQHAWVEVYFPGYGWIEFDPTRAVGVPSLIPDGSRSS